MQKEIDNNNREQLMLDFQAGKSSAYQTVFYQYYQRICLFLVKMGIDKEVAEELAHDTFLKVWAKSSDFSELASLRSFLFVSAKNAALNFLDKSKRLRLRDEKFQKSQEWIDFPITQQIIYTETIQALHAAIAQLPEQCSKIMHLLFVEGYTPQETAKELGLSDSTIYNQKMRGIQLLRRILQKDQLFIFMLLFAEVSYFCLK